MNGAEAPLDVLLVDGDPVVHKSYGKELRLEGWNVMLAADGFEALQAAQVKKFDVILLDVRARYRTDRGLLRALRDRTAAKDAVVFLLSNPGDADLVDRAMREGADGIVDKARVSPREAILGIRNVLEARERAATPAAAAPGGALTAVADGPRRFRRAGTDEDSDARASATRPGTSVVNDPTAAARAVAARVAQREAEERGRGPPLSSRLATSAAVARETRMPSTAPAKAAGPSGPTDGSPTFSTVLSRVVGESAKLAAALGLPPDLVCPACGQQLALRLWPDQAMEAGVCGHFYCPRCMSA